MLRLFTTLLPAGALLLTVGFFAGGCATTAAYVNIPAQAGDVARSSPNAENVRAVQAAALTALIEDRPIEGPTRLLLPGGADALTHAEVVRRVGPPFVSPRQADEQAVNTVEVQAVRIRGMDAEVDILRPTRGMQQLATVRLKYDPISGWHGRSIRYWRGAGAFQPVEE